MMNNKDLPIIYIFLDIDGVLNNYTYQEYCYSKHGKLGMGGRYFPFDPNCLENLMILCQIIEKNTYEVRIILTSTWRLNEIDTEIVKARLMEYGLRIYNKTEDINHNRGLEIET